MTCFGRISTSDLCPDMFTEVNGTRILFSLHLIGRYVVFADYAKRNTCSYDTPDMARRGMM